MADFTDIIQEINTNLPDNNTQSITAEKLRTTLIDLTTQIDTVQDDFETTVGNTLEGYETQVENLLTNICVDNLNSTETSKALSANQGRVIKNILFGTNDETLSDELTTLSVGTYGFQNASSGSPASTIVYYYSYGNSRASRISVTSFSEQEIGKYRYLRVQANNSWYAYVTFLKKDRPTTNNMTYQDLVDGDYLCKSVHYDAAHVTIGVSTNTTKDIEIPRDCKSIVFAGRLSTDGSSTSTTARIPVSIKAYGIIQPDNIYYQSPIPNGYVNSEMIGDGQVNTNDIADGAITGNKLEDGLIEKELTGESNEYFSFNLIDFNNLSSGYVNASGTITQVSSKYTTQFIKLDGKKVYWANGFSSSYGSVTNIGAAVYKADKSHIRTFAAGYSGSYDPIASDEDAEYIRLTYEGNYTQRYVVYANADGSNPMESQSSIVTGDIDDYFDQTINSANINLSFPKENVPELIPAYSSVGQNGFSKTYDSISVYGNITSSEYPSYLKCNHTISFKGYLADTLSGTDTIKFGIGRNSSNGKILNITPTQAIIQRYDSGTNSYQNNVSFTHNLTIKDFIMCEITFTWYGGKFRIVSSGGSFVQEWQNSQYSYTDNAQINYGRAFVEPSITLTNVKLTQSSDRFMKPVWVCGDSYTSMYSARWTYQLINNFGIDGFLIDGFAGAKSQDIYPDLVQMLKYGTPKYLYWCLGMNDNSVLWKNYSQLVEKLCRERGIILIYQTIPWPTSGYAEKAKINQFIKDSGYRYVDGYSALCKDANGTWYDGMNDDGTHPTVLGAKVLAGQVLVDFPEIANYK